MTESEYDDLIDKIIDVLSAYEKSCESPSPETVKECAKNEAFVKNDKHVTIISRILERYTKFGRYNELKKLIETLEKRGFFDFNIKYCKQRSTLAETSDSDKYISYILFRLDRMHNSALNTQRYVMPTKN